MLLPLENQLVKAIINSILYLAPPVKGDCKLKGFTNQFFIDSILDAYVSFAYYH